MRTAHQNATEMTAADKKAIDEMTYEQLLRHWRFGSLGERMFVGKTGSYYSNTMRKKRFEITTAEAIQASKNIGWDQSAGVS